jgi:galactoside O-acetyltransferase
MLRMYDTSDVYIVEGTLMLRISPMTRIRKELKYQRGCTIDDFCYVSCNLSLGKFCHIGASCTFLGGNGEVCLGDFVNIAPGCRIISASHDYKWGGLNGPEVPEEFKGKSITENIKFGDHVLIGSNSVVLPGVELPEGVAVGALSLVSKRIYRPWTLYAGNPIREIGPRAASDILESAERLTNELNSS